MILTGLTGRKLQNTFVLRQILDREIVTLIFAGPAQYIIAVTHGCPLQDTVIEALRKAYHKPLRQSIGHVFSILLLNI